MADDDLQRRLEGLGRSDTPPVDGAFANRLETDLRLQGAGRGSGGFSWTGLLLRPATVVAALIVVVGIAAVIRLAPDDPTVAIVSADGTTVSIPGASGLESARAGLDLPEGSRIEVAEGSNAVVAGVVLEGGSTALVVDGRIEVVDSPALTSIVTPTTLAPPTTAATTTMAPPDRESSTVATPTTRRVPGPTVTTARPPEPTAPPTTSDVDPPVTTIPETTIPPTTDPATTDVSPTEPPPTLGPTVTAAPVDPTVAPPPTTKPVDVAPTDPTIALSAGAVRDGQATLMWSVEGPTDAIAFWEVRLVRSDSTTTVAIIRFADARRLRVEVPGPRSAFRVIARSGGDGVVARSALVSPGG